MANKTYQIKIESILGGINSMSELSRKDEVNDILSIDPSLGLLNGEPSSYGKPAGILTPTITTIHSGTPNNSVLWMVSNPKNSFVYVYDFGGSVYTYNGSTISGLADLNDTGTAHGNGCEYYDNYMYFATDTTIARYGPLDGTPTFTDDYWTTTLGLTPLTHTTYPVIQTTYVDVTLPNHPMYRHSDGRLYFTDIVGNIGVLHYIETTKNIVEGDTNNGSTYNAVEFGYGLHPTAIGGYGDYIVVAFFEGSYDTKFKQKTAKIAFWDTTSNKANQIIWNELPDSYISKIINSNGVLYFISGEPNTQGFRLIRYLGGNSFKDEAFFAEGTLPAPGATLVNGNSFLFGSFSIDSGIPCIYSRGLKTSLVSDNIFKYGAFTTPMNGAVTAICNYPSQNSTSVNELPSFAITDSNTATYKVGRIQTGSATSGVYAVFESRVFNIGQPFKITKISIPITKALPASAGGVLRIYADNDSTNYTVISAISSFSGKKRVVVRPPNTCVGNNNFKLVYQFNTSNYAITLPITIEYELIDD